MRFAWCLFARKNYSCKNTSKTAAWLEAAPWRRDPTYLDALRVPPNVHLLAYGMSHVAQVAIAIACENADALVGPNGTRRTFDKDDPSRPIETWHLADRNASVTLLINRERYQEAGSGTAANLTRLLADRRFTHVAFNEPHPTCFFVRRREPKSRKRPCIDDTGQYTNDAKRYDASQLTRFDPLPVFAEFFAPDRIVEVSNWATSTNDTARRGGREYVDSRAEIIGRGGFCAVTRPGVLRAGLGTWCDATTGHQCMQPRGPPTLVARALMLRLRASLGGGGVS